MPFLTDFANALENYVADSVSLNIVDVDVPGSIINVNEVCAFQARIQNNGLLNMTSVSLEIDALNGTLRAGLLSRPRGHQMAAVPHQLRGFPRMLVE